MTTTAGVHEAKCTQDIHQSLVNKQLPPDEHFVDSAYVNAQLLLQAQEQGITLVGPTHPDVSWQARTDGAFDLTQFQIDWQQQKVVCPQGHSSISWAEYVDHAGNPFCSREVCCS